MLYLITQIFVCLLLAALLGGVIGWWLKHLAARQRLARLEARLAKAEAAAPPVAADRGAKALEGCRGELADCRTRLEELEAALAAAQNGDTTAVEKLGFSGLAAGAAATGDNYRERYAALELKWRSGEPPPRDNLKKVEGIGPKIEGMLNDVRIYTFAALAAAKVSDLQAVLDQGGKRYRIHDPGTWPQQAALMAEDKWDEVKVLQDRLKGGREVP